MHPVLFEAGGISVYSYGLLIAVGAIAGVAYMAVQGKRDEGLSFDKANTLFLVLFGAAVAGGKVFLFFEDPGYYLDHPLKLLSGRGFVFYGSFLFAIPAMLVFFRYNRLHPYRMLDIMAVTTCLVHFFGRLGCFMAGCCYGIPTTSFAGIAFTDDACYAQPRGVPLHPTQLYEAFLILIVMVVLVYRRSRRAFYGQLFLLYLMLYGAGRIVLEFFRGDSERGFVFSEHVSHSQLIAALMIVAVAGIYRVWQKRNPVAAAEQTTANHR